MNVSLILRRPRFVVAGAFITLSLLFLLRNQYQIRNLLSYSTRPLWDKEEGPKNLIPHYYAEGLSMKDEEVCALHGWTKRETKRTETVEVFDAILMSSELDLLEIRMNELDSVVNKWFIIESNTTFTGMPKEMYYGTNKERFQKFAHKIEYYPMHASPLGPSENAWSRELHARNTMTTQIHAHVQEFKPNTKTLVIMSDVDEIPSRSSIQLLKTCNFGDTIHLKLKNYLYSFEWYIGQGSWRASVNLLNPNTYYRHSMAPVDWNGRENVLADAGWHCSFCFRTIEEYKLKMQGYSHHDRLGGRKDLLETERIQKVICEGKDVFDMLPEAFTYGDLLSQMNPQPQYGAVHIPKHVIENHDRFKFLLPKGCIREGPV